MKPGAPWSNHVPTRARYPRPETATKRDKLPLPPATPTSDPSAASDVKIPDGEARRITSQSMIHGRPFAAWLYGTFILDFAAAEDEFQKRDEGACEDHWHGGDVKDDDADDSEVLDPRTHGSRPARKFQRTQNPLSRFLALAKRLI